MIAALLIALIASRQYEFSLKDGSPQLSRRETADEKKCRLERERLAARAQAINDELSAQRAMLSSLAERVGMTQQACLAEVSNQPDRVQAGCVIPLPPTRASPSMMSFPTHSSPPPPPRGASTHYLAVLRELAQDRLRIETQIGQLIEQRTQLDRLLETRDLLCLQ